MEEMHDATKIIANLIALIQHYKLEERSIGPGLPSKNGENDR